MSALTETDADADGTFETRVETKYLVDHQNFTGYQQVIRETHFDADTGEVIKIVDYTFGLDEISQSTETYDANGDPVRETLWFLHDGHGSVRLLANLTGAIASIAGVEQIYFFDAYGSALNEAAQKAANTLLYSGEQWDARINQQYLRARYYSPQAGHFNRLDPFFGNSDDSQSFHKYLYVHADPITGVDPTGHEFGACDQNRSWLIWRDRDNAAFVVHGRTHDGRTTSA